MSAIPWSHSQCDAPGNESTDAYMTHTLPLSPLSDFESVQLQVSDTLHFSPLPESIDDIIEPAPVVDIMMKSDGEECLSVKSVDPELLSLPNRSPIATSTPAPRKRTFACFHENCGKAFSKKWNLQAHLRLHTGEKPFTCRIGCGEKYMWMSSLKSHEKRKCKLLPDSARIRKKIRPRPSKATVRRFAEPRHAAPLPSQISPCVSFSSAVSEPKSKYPAYRDEFQIAMQPMQYCNLNSMLGSADQRPQPVLMEETIGCDFSISDVEPSELGKRDIVLELETILSRQFV